MQLPGWASLGFLAYLIVLLPIAGVRSARGLRDAKAEDLPSRETILISSMVNLAIMLGLAWLVARGLDFEIFAIPQVRGLDLLAAGAVLALFFVIRKVPDHVQPETERRKAFVYKLAPRTPREHALAAVTALMAGVTEEAAYRGVAMAILTSWLGNPWIAVLICAAAFAAGHWPQGTLSGVLVFFLALLMHGLVAWTGTLVLAMIVHATYDLVAFALASREAIRFDQEEISASAA